ncbi:MAG: DEAD/DEAH box helicase family protein [Candidatus Diapherotrites archaeon]
MLHLPLKQEIEAIFFPKYALKMATGSGKTWVLAALLVWQYFNQLNNERPGSYSYRFLIVTPGHEVLNRMLDSFKGKKDPKTGSRNPQTSDYKKSLFMPDGANWRDRFHLEILGYLFEPCFEGIRVLIYKDKKDISVFNRKGCGYFVLRYNFFYR